MSYTVEFPVRRLDAVFGTAYPALTLSPRQKVRFIGEVIANKYGLTLGFSGSLEVDVHKDVYRFKVSGNSIKPGYQKATAIEKYLYTIKRLPFLSPPRFWNKWFVFGHPTDVFMIDSASSASVFEWLQLNVNYNDYQLYSKFGEDVSLALRNAEHATMFKLTFGDQDI